MSIQRRTDEKLGTGLDVVAAIGGLVLGIVLLPLQMVASQVYITTLPFVIAGASAVYLVTVRTRTPDELPTIRRWLAQGLPIVTFLCLSVMVLIGSLQGRSFLFYYLGAWVGVVLFVQILFTRDDHFHAGMILTQVMVVALVVRFAALYSTPGYIGIDVWTHVPNWAAAVRETNSLAPMSTRKYYASPFFHLLVVVGAQLLDVSIREALFLTVGLAVPVSILLIYTTTRLFVDARLATFAAAAFAVNPYIVEWGIHLIPTSLGLVFYVGILYGLTRILHAESYRGRDFLLVLLFSVAVILTHQISSFITLVFIGSALIAGLAFTLGIFDSRIGSSMGALKMANLAGLLVFDLGLITFMWSLTPFKGSNFLETILSYFLSTITTSAGFLQLASGGSVGGGAGGGSPSLLGTLVNYVDATGLLLLLLLTIVGSLYLLHRDHRSPAAYTSVVAVVVMLFFVFGFPLFGVRTFVPGRWMAFLVAPMTVVGAIGLGTVLDRSPRTIAIAILLMFCLVYPAVSMVATDGTLESPPLGEAQTRQAYTEQELAAVRTLSDVTSPSEAEGNQIGTDHPYYTVFQRAHEHRVKVAHLEDGTVKQRGFVYRDYQDTGATYFESFDETPYRQSVSPETVCRTRDVTYDNGDVRLCLNGDGDAASP